MTSETKKRIRRAILARLVKENEIRRQDFAEAAEQFRTEYLTRRAAFSFFQGR